MQAKHPEEMTIHVRFTEDIARVGTMFFNDVRFLRAEHLEELEAENKRLKAAFEAKRLFKEDATAQDAQGLLLPASTALVYEQLYREHVEELEEARRNLAATQQRLDNALDTLDKISDLIDDGPA